MLWNDDGAHLSTTLEFADFAEAFAFMTRVGLVAQEVGHHPDLSISWNRVKVSLTTHDAGNTVTERDRDLAARIDRIAGRR